MKPSCLVILTLLGLHGCNTVEDPFLDSATASAGPMQTGNREVPVHLARASLTSLGEAPLSVRQTMSGGGTSQEIVYANRTTVPGDNRLTLVAGSESRKGGQRGPSRSAVAQVLKTDFPGLRMNMDPVIRRNGYGPYGSATGKLGNNGGCVYAWQALDKHAAADLEEPITIRFRYCHPEIGPEILADLLGGLTLRNAGTLTGLALGTHQQMTSTYAYPSPVSGSHVARTPPSVLRVEPAGEQPVQSTASLEDSSPSTATAIPMPQ